MDWFDRMVMRRFALRIVIPVLNEGAALTPRLQALQTLRRQGAEVVVVDGGSTDDSWARARPWVDRLLASATGRAIQMNAGAQDTDQSQADALLFLHADTELPGDAMSLLTDALRDHAWGRFDVRLDSDDWRLRLVAFMMNGRSRLSGIATGDQAMFMRATVFHAVGGFPSQALMEDIEMSSRLKRIERPACLRQTVLTSARKWHRHGVWRTVVLMWRLRLAYFFGASPESLMLAYGYRVNPAPVSAAIAILAKAPIAGLAKTRLIPALGPAMAARTQRQFIRHTLHIAQQAQMGVLTLWCAPDENHRCFRTLRRRLGVQTRSQPAGDLGERMRRCAEHHFANTPELPLLIIGTDCPVLAPAHLQEAARLLQDHDACLIPAEDGGYVLLGLRKMLGRVFERIDWSTPAVLAQTRLALQQAAATWVEMPALWDVDEAADWRRWQALQARTVQSLEGAAS
jgi:rSAM/selenodomain-associated transferase 2/rSAM/selenodomain-associated transferase 1